MQGSAVPREEAAVEVPVMGEGSRTALRALGAGLALGVLGNALLRETPWGVNAGLWVAALLAAAAWVARSSGAELRGEGRWMAVPALLFAAFLAWRASPVLVAVNVLAVLLSLGLGAWRTREGSLRRARLGEYLAGLVGTGLRAAFAVPVLAVERMEWRAVAPVGRSAQAAAVARGAFLALPLLLLFNALFMSADPVFGELVRDVFRWDAGALVETVFWVVFWGWAAAGVVWAVLRGPVRAPEGLLPDVPRLGVLEAVTTLALLDTLFLAFVAVQFRYLFGGAELVRSSAGMGWGEYARSGFFELVTVAALVLPLLLALDAVVRPADQKQQRLFRLLCGALVVLLFVVMASAIQRMRLYQDAYGLTELRLYTTAFMAWLAVVFLWLAATVLRGRRERFTWGAVLTGLLVAGTLNVLNPDALIARTNLRRVGAPAGVDAHYLARLSPDAAPVLAAALPRLPQAERCALAEELVKEGSHPGDWRSWSWSRQRAARVATDVRAC
jgi:hypothetical protein